jgi:FKBP-type peptidyl-prolyl cis-trans isomerase
MPCPTRTASLARLLRSARPLAVAAAITAAWLAACDPDPHVRRDPAFDEGLIERYERAQADDADEGTITTASGLRYRVLEPGTGDTPGYRDTVTVHYRGTNQAGEVFDESYSRGRPARFALTGVVEGFSEGLQLMREGARYRLIIPSYLAYGRRGSPDGRIGPDETLTFEVELIKVN